MDAQWSWFETSGGKNLQKKVSFCGNNPKLFHVFLVIEVIKNGDLTLCPVDWSLLALHTTYWPITLGASAEQNDLLHIIQDYHGDPR